MLDTIYSQHKIGTPRILRGDNFKPFDWKGFYFIPVYNRVGEISFYKSENKNLLLKMTNNILHVKNSWHKYYHGNNYCDYTLSDIESTFCELKDKLGDVFSNAEVNKIAYGCVLDENPYNHFPNWVLYRTKLPHPMLKNGVKYGAYFDFTDFKFKGYDKTYESKIHEGFVIPENKFRLECEVKYMRHLFKRKYPIVINSVKDLYNIETIQLLGDDLIKKHKLIEKQITMNLNGLKLKQLHIIGSMRDKEVRPHLMKNHNKTFKRYKKQYADLTAERNSNGNDIIEQKLVSKISDLINK